VLCQQELKRRNVKVRGFPYDEALLHRVSAVLVKNDGKWATATKAPINGECQEAPPLSAKFPDNSCSISGWGQHDKQGGTIDLFICPKPKAAAAVLDVRFGQEKRDLGLKIDVVPMTSYDLVTVGTSVVRHATRADFAGWSVDCAVALQMTNS